MAMLVGLQGRSGYLQHAQSVGSEGAAAAFTAGLGDMAVRAA